ncbi:MAG: SDR family oxidoreductase [Alphaproteobacteria bacterium]|nr:SDR family oxidoreductase [Alphaproteobacteria bacterium]
MADRLRGRKILITGGASGIGRATAELFVREGASVAILDRSETAQPLAREIGATALCADIADARAVRDAVEAATRSLGGLDGVVNAAGIFYPNGLADTSEAVFSQTLAVNLTGTFLVIQAAAAHLLRAERASIVNIGSGVGLLPTGPGNTAYVASKGGVIAMSKALAFELAPRVRVNVVCPGSVETPMTAGFLRTASGEIDPAIARRYALERAAAPGEIAAAILFLTSEDASFVTGVALAVDGGRTFH